MLAEYDVWFWDLWSLVHNLLSNPDFKSDFDYAPFQEQTGDGLHRFQDFMSGNWAWKQAVGLRYFFLLIIDNQYVRMLLPRILLPMAQSTAPLFLVATRLRYP